MILRVKFTKENYLKYISHLDLMRLFQRIFRKCDIPIKYSQGFNPHPKFSLASPLSLGISSEGEYMDIELEEKISEKIFMKRMNDELPKQIRILKCKYVSDNKSISSLISWAYYRIKFSLEKDLDIDLINKEISKFLSLQDIVIKKQKRKRKKIIEKEQNIRPQICNISVKNLKENTVCIETILKAGDKGNLKPKDLLKALTNKTKIKVLDEYIRIHRIDLFIEKDSKMMTPF